LCHDIRSHFGSSSRTRQNCFRSRLLVALKIMVVDLDKLIPYVTSKSVAIRHWKLGLLKYCVMTLIFLKIVVWEILYRCKHLDPSPARGFGTITVRHPVDDCNWLDKDCHAKYDSIDTLRYCSQYNGAAQRRTAEANTEDGHGGEARQGMQQHRHTEFKAAKLYDKDVDAEKLKSKSRLKPQDAKVNDADGGDVNDMRTDVGSLHVEDVKVGEFVTDQRTCKYFDNQRLMWTPPGEAQVFIPTRVTKVKQVINPDCYDPEAKDVKGDRGGRSKYNCSDAYITTEEKDFFVANIGDFTIEFSHSFESVETGLYGPATDYQGFMLRCSSNHPENRAKECQLMKVPDTSGETDPEDEVGLMEAAAFAPTLRVGPRGGDMLTLSDLLYLTPLAQTTVGHRDHSILDSQMPSGFGFNGSSMREHGGMLLLAVEYSNVGKFHPGIPVPSFLHRLIKPIKPVTYTYRPYLAPTPCKKRYQVIYKGDDEHTRTIMKWYGIEIKMNFNGQLVKFSWTRLLITLTAGFVLMSLATTSVDFLACYILPSKEVYKILKYQVSEDLSDFHLMRDRENMESLYPTGDLLLSKLNENGEVCNELTQKELLQVLVATEIRLSRLDGADPKMVFPNEEEPDRRNYCLGNFKREFYRQHMDEDDFKKLSYPCREVSFRAQTTNNVLE